ncbi:6-phosphogluconolactonase [Parasulfuritortus cantonensis]|uniref:6-phosphogluconolactonase n=1 Tax=Parasulfuritortus cantonensis TaxID=2528202 RepID=A0A4R1B1A1_9PROT|nr:6-phosphogluconolactonase [Parasulfuritortus cantonensis]TCJ11774.1 6-phosphogluconolactonase [Parasulfuritortus cantonensis]
MATRWHVAEDETDWLAQALAYTLAAEAEALAEHGQFRVCLAGGGTPGRLYRELAATARDWPRWQVWYGDERCLPPGHPERNSALAEQAWLRRVPIPAANVHSIPAELGARAGAEVYARQLAGAARFDLVLLGLGEDGHTASLFPGHDWGTAADAPDTLAVFDAPKPPPERVSLSARRLSEARRVLFLAGGAGKRAAVAAWRGGAAIPAAAIRPAAGVDVLIDQSAYGERA